MSQGENKIIAISAPQLHDDPERTKPIGLARYATEFYAAALAADRTMGELPGYELVPPIPVMYLIGHSIELSLKAFLLFHGVTLAQLRGKSYGHDLKKCFRKAKELGILNEISFEESETSAFGVLNELYSTKQLEYIVTGAKEFPAFGYVQSMSKKLVDGVSRVVGYTRT